MEQSMLGNGKIMVLMEREKCIFLITHITQGIFLMEYQMARVD